MNKQTDYFVDIDLNAEGIDISELNLDNMDLDLDLGDAGKPIDIIDDAKTTATISENEFKLLENLITKAENYINFVKSYNPSKELRDLLRIYKNEAQTLIRVHSQYTPDLSEFFSDTDLTYDNYDDVDAHLSEKIIKQINSLSPEIIFNKVDEWYKYESNSDVVNCIYNLAGLDKDELSSLCITDKLTEHTLKFVSGLRELKERMLQESGNIHIQRLRQVFKDKAIERINVFGKDSAQLYINLDEQTQVIHCNQCGAEKEFNTLLFDSSLYSLDNLSRKFKQSDYLFGHLPFYCEDCGTIHYFNQDSLRIIRQALQTQKEHFDSEGHFSTNVDSIVLLPHPMVFDSIDGVQCRFTQTEKIYDTSALSKSITQGHYRTSLRTRLNNSFSFIIDNDRTLRHIALQENALSLINVPQSFNINDLTIAVLNDSKYVKDIYQLEDLANVHIYNLTKYDNMLHVYNIYTGSTDIANARYENKECESFLLSLGVDPTDTKSLKAFKDNILTQRQVELSEITKINKIISKCIADVINNIYLYLAFADIPDLHLEKSNKYLKSTRFISWFNSNEDLNNFFNRAKDAVSLNIWNSLFLDSNYSTSKISGKLKEKNKDKLADLNKILANVTIERLRECVQVPIQLSTQEAYRVYTSNTALSLFFIQNLNNYINAGDATIYEFIYNLPNLKSICDLYKSYSNYIIGLDKISALCDSFKNNHKELWDLITDKQYTDFEFTCYMILTNIGFSNEEVTKYFEDNHTFKGIIKDIRNVRYHKADTTLEEYVVYANEPITDDAFVYSNSKFYFVDEDLSTLKYLVRSVYNQINWLEYHNNVKRNLHPYLVYALTERAIDYYFNGADIFKKLGANGFVDTKYILADTDPLTTSSLSLIRKEKALWDYMLDTDNKFVKLDYTDYVENYKIVTSDSDISSTNMIANRDMYALIYSEYDLNNPMFKYLTLYILMQEFCDIANLERQLTKEFGLNDEDFWDYIKLLHKDKLSQTPLLDLCTNLLEILEPIKTEFISYTDKILNRYNSLQQDKLKTIIMEVTGIEF